MCPRTSFVASRTIRNLGDRCRPWLAGSCSSSPCCKSSPLSFLPVPLDEIHSDVVQTLLGQLGLLSLLGPGLEGILLAVEGVLTGIERGDATPDRYRSARPEPPPPPPPSAPQSRAAAGTTSTSRAALPTGRAAIGSPASQRSRSSASASADWRTAGAGPSPGTSGR